MTEPAMRREERCRPNVVRFRPDSLYPNRDLYRRRYGYILRIGHRYDE